MLRRLAVVMLCCVVAIGCGTTKWTDTKRTATEQILLSDAMDRAVTRLDFRALAGKAVYLDPTYVKTATDWEYLISTMRQHMLASGCILRDKKEDADYVVEIRSGAIGTDRHDLVYGIPATELPSFVALAGVPSAIPEMPFVKKTEQLGTARIAAFAYNVKTGRPVWQSGVIPVESNAKDLWVFGAGPFQRGTIYDGTRFAGDNLEIPLVAPTPDGSRNDHFSVTDEAYFAEPVEVDTTEQVAETAKSEAAKPKTAKQTSVTKDAALAQKDTAAEETAAKQAASSKQAVAAQQGNATKDSTAAKEPAPAQTAASSETPQTAATKPSQPGQTAVSASPLPAAPMPQQIGPDQTSAKKEGVVQAEYLEAGEEKHSSEEP